MTDIFCHIGDSIGYIRKSMKPNETEWKYGLSETTVSSVRICKSSVRVYTKRFRPLDDDEIRINTGLMSGRNHLILVQEPFVLTEETRRRAEQWIELVNEDQEYEKQSRLFA